MHWLRKLGMPATLRHLVSKENVYMLQVFFFFFFWGTEHFGSVENPFLQS